MKATLTHEDLQGTVAAEVTENYHHSLQEYMEKHLQGFDTQRYYCRGCRIGWKKGQERFTLQFACFDKAERHYVLFVTDDQPLTELPQIFTEMQIVLGVQMGEVFVEAADIHTLPCI